MLRTNMDVEKSNQLREAGTNAPSHSAFPTPSSITSQLAAGILQAALDCIIVIDHQGRVTEWNAASETTFGYTHAQAMGAALADLIIPHRLRDAHYVGLTHYLMTGSGPILNQRIEVSALRSDGTEFPVELAVVPIDEKPPRFAAYLRDITERKRAEAEQVRQTRHAALRIAVSTALARGGTLTEMLQRCAEPLVEHLDAAFVRIWTLDPDEDALVLQASAGLYTHRDGEHSRIRVGEKKIGWIAQVRRAHLTNDVLSDERIAEKEWAEREGMVAFAGYPLLLEDRVVGVVALFARHPLSTETLEALASVADALAQGVYRKQVEQRLIQSEARQREFLRDVLASITGGRFRLCDSAEDLPERFAQVGEMVALTATSLRAVRRRTLEAAQAAVLSTERSSDLLTAVGEATMNAVTHAHGGVATVTVDAGGGRVQVWVQDTGDGIAISHLPRATLEKGYTTAGTLGHGFKMMLQTVDRVWLLTGPQGTTVVLEQHREQAAMGWLAAF